MNIQAFDGEIYQSPIVYGADWYLTTDEDGPIFVIEKKYTHHAGNLEHAKKRMQEAGFDSWIVKKAAKDAIDRTFPPVWDSRPYMAYRIGLYGPIPIPQIHKGKRSNIAEGDVWFWIDVSATAIVCALNGHPTELGQLLVKNYETLEAGDKELKKLLLRKMPWLTFLTQPIRIARKDRV